jgi:hypothetical protein
VENNNFKELIVYGRQTVIVARIVASQRAGGLDALIETFADSFGRMPFAGQLPCRHFVCTQTTIKNF